MTFERHGFSTRTQKEGEPVDAFVTELRQKASVCEFGELKDSLIRYRIVCGIRSDTVRAGLLRERELTLQSAIDICRAAEVSETQLREMGDVKNVHAVKDKKQNYKQRVAKPKPVIRCKYCGKDHIKGADHCPAYGRFFSKCNQKNIMQQCARMGCSQQHIIPNIGNQEIVRFIRSKKVKRTVMRTF